MTPVARPAARRALSSATEDVPTVPARRPVRLPVGLAPVQTRQPTNVARLCYWAILICWAELLLVLLYSNSGYSWHFFAEGAALLLGGHPVDTSLAGGLHLYANYPQLQFGPLAVLVAAALGPFTTQGGWLVVVWMQSLAGLIAMFLVEHAARTLRPDLAAAPRMMTATMLIGGGSFLTSWELLAVHFSHLDDVLALLMLAYAVACMAYGSPVLGGICVGLAVDAKPWALACAALLLLFPGRARWGAVGVAAGVVAVAWLPFVLADPHTLGAASTFVIPNVPASALRALGVNTPSTPSWDRGAQIALGGLLGIVALLRRRWEAIFALGIGARIVLDPSVYTYYTAGLALGLLLWDLVGYRMPSPRLGLLCFLGLTVATFTIRDAVVLGQLRLWTVLVSTAVMLAAPRHLTMPMVSPDPQGANDLVRDN
jgi:hypothetical protein